MIDILQHKLVCFCELFAFCGTVFQTLLQNRERYGPSIPCDEECTVLNSMTDVLVIIDSHQNIPKPGQDDNSEHNGCDRLFRIWTSTRIKKTPQLAWQKTLFEIRWFGGSFCFLFIFPPQPVSCLYSNLGRAWVRAPRCSCIYIIYVTVLVYVVCVCAKVTPWAINQNILYNNIYILYIM